MQKTNNNLGPKAVLIKNAFTKKLARLTKQKKASILQAVAVESGVLSFSKKFKFAGAKSKTALKKKKTSSWKKSASVKKKSSASARI